MVLCILQTHDLVLGPANLERGDELMLHAGLCDVESSHCCPRRWQCKDVVTMPLMVVSAN